MNGRARALDFLAVAAWMDAARARAWSRVLAALMALGAVAWIAMARGGIDPTGRPLGADFVAFWSAARLVVVDAAPPVSVYDAARLTAAQHAALPGLGSRWWPFPYPPTFLLACLPLGLAPYPAALAGWLAVTGLGWWAALRRWIAGRRELVLAGLAFPAAAVNVANGQNGFLSAALLGGGAALLDRRPFMAGALFGLLAVKPHLGLLVPIALVASRRWRAVGGAALSGCALTGASAAVFGMDIWRAYPGQVALMRQVVERGLLDPAKVLTPFGASLQLGLSPAAGYGAQALAAFVALVLLAVVAARRPGEGALGATLIAASLVATPYLLDYDLVVAAAPLAWLYGRAQADGFRRWEKLTMLAVYVLPLIARPVATYAGLPVAPLALAALLALVTRRALAARRVI